MQYRMNYESKEILVEGRKDETSNYELYASFDANSKLIFSGNFPNKICEEIKVFLQTQGIHLDENGIAYQLSN